VKQALLDYMKTTKSWLDRRLPSALENAEIPDKLKQSMIYSLSAGGKRFRPILLFSTLELLGETKEKGLKTAIALEMIHTYSLIHDDLPAMDNDRLRRGKPTNHVVFGEATAILAGDGLLTYAFQELCSDQGLSDAVRCRLTWLLAAAAGPEGMVGGQESDLEAESETLTIEQLMSVHRRKTGRLIRFPLEAAAVIAGATEPVIHALTAYADHLGIAFQIGDDVLDVVGSEGKLGKPIGSDWANHKNTYVSLLGLDGAKERLADHINRAKRALREAGLQDGVLSDLADFLRYRAY
jgi:geranylgeranyl diphosphate synthase type II